jgi:[acyl-carrier-protein] S-malonyltransferase
VSVVSEATQAHEMGHGPQVEHAHAHGPADTHGGGHAHRPYHADDAEHTHGPYRVDGEPTAPGIGPVLGWLDGRPIPRSGLDQRLAALRGGPRSSALPVPGSSEDRQLVRWVAQVMLTELLCEAEAAERGLDIGQAPPVRLDQRAAVELGSITAAAFEGSAAVRAVYEAVTADVSVPPEQAAAYAAATARPAGPAEWRLATPDGEFDAAPDTLPQRLSDALAEVRPGETVNVDGYEVTLLGTRASDVGRASDGEHLLGAARRLAFVHWLDHARAHRLRLVPGLEHPGDPAQPDNHHRH